MEDEDDYPPFDLSCLTRPPPRVPSYLLKVPQLTPWDPFAVVDESNYDPDNPPPPPPRSRYLGETDDELFPPRGYTVVGRSLVPLDASSSGSVATSAAREGTRMDVDELSTAVGELGVGSLRDSSVAGSTEGLQRRSIEGSELPYPPSSTLSNASSAPQHPNSNSIRSAFPSSKATTTTTPSIDPAVLKGFKTLEIPLYYLPTDLSPRPTPTETPTPKPTLTPKPTPAPTTTDTPTSPSIPHYCTLLWDSKESLPMMVILVPFLRRWMEDLIRQTEGREPGEYVLDIYVQRCSARMLHSRCPQHTSIEYPGVVNLLADIEKYDIFLPVGIRAIGKNIFGASELLVNRMKPGSKILVALNRGKGAILELDPPTLVVALREQMVREGVWGDVDGAPATRVVTFEELAPKWLPGGSRDKNPFIGTDPSSRARWVSHELFRGYVSRSVISAGVKIGMQGGEHARIPILDDMLGGQAGQDLLEVYSKLSAFGVKQRGLSTQLAKQNRSSSSVSKTTTKRPRITAPVAAPADPMVAQLAPSLDPVPKCGRCKTADADTIKGVLKDPRCGVCYRLDRMEAAPLCQECEKRAAVKASKTLCEACYVAGRRKALADSGRKCINCKTRAVKYPTLEVCGTCYDTDPKCRSNAPAGKSGVKK